MHGKQKTQLEPTSSSTNADMDRPIVAVKMLLLNAEQHFGVLRFFKLPKEGCKWSISRFLGLGLP